MSLNPRSTPYPSSISRLYKFRRSSKETSNHISGHYEFKCSTKDTPLKPDSCKYFSFQSVVAEIVKTSLKQIQRRRSPRCQCSYKHPHNSRNVNFKLILPPRHEWLRPFRLRRRKMNSYEIRFTSIYERIMRDYRKGDLENKEWGRNLVALVHNIQHEPTKCHSDNNIPLTIRLRREASQVDQGNKVKYKTRIITEHSTFIQRIMWGLISRYLKDLIDPLLDKGVHSYRLKSLSHNSAIDALIKYRALHATVPLYVAECDIIGLFDRITHYSVLTALRQAIPSHDPFGGIALKLISMLLVSYGKKYHNYIFNYLLNKRNVPIADEYINEHTSLGNESTFREYPRGLPTGSPISPVLANLVLTAVDNAARTTCDNQLFYMRYADNILLAHPQRNTCIIVYDNILNTIKSIGLSAHACDYIGTNHQLFICNKSKPVYKWANRYVFPNSIPWVSVLGYAIRYDGFLKISHETIRKLMFSQYAMALRYVSGTLESIKRNIPLCPKFIHNDSFLRGRFKKLSIRYQNDILCNVNALVLSNRLRYIYICHISGTSSLLPNPTAMNRSPPKRTGLASGFPLFANNMYPRNELKRVDRNMERLIRWSYKIFCAHLGEHDSDCHRKIRYNYFSSLSQSWIKNCNHNNTSRAAIYYGNYKNKIYNSLEYKDKIIANWSHIPSVLMEFDRYW